MLNLEEQPLPGPNKPTRSPTDPDPHKPPEPMRPDPTREPVPPPEEQPEPKIDPPSGLSEPPPKWVTEVRAQA
ncbi:MAG: hypothetical protein J0H65_06250 [Rhizobiales bacterium]|nr:hypothetical protein [Hyphomicrobiales bacterium]